jgi:transcriptional regulator with XRE-family HTH domain
MAERGLDPQVLREARIRAGLSQTDLAAELGVSQATISTWESGTAHPRPHTLARLFSFLPLESSDEAPPQDASEPSSSSPYGEWLIRARTAQGLSRRELAERSGVSEPQIWNIETGNTLNPRSQTRERLAVALGESAPPEIVELTENDATIPDVGTLTDFDPHRNDDLPDEAGVYVFYDISDRPVYVGQSDNIKRRIRDHADKFWFKAPILRHMSGLPMAFCGVRSSKP